ncbi:MAG: phage scaffold protein [Clostridiaceae bacterium]|nr:phage scaffold protein [Clostridiaceae bacterium]
MSEFKTITTQEEFDAAISERLKREQETLNKKYADYDELKTSKATLEKQLNDLNQKLEANKKSSEEQETTIADLTAKVKKYETDKLKTSIAIEHGLSYELASRLTGDDEKAIREDAKLLADLIGKNKKTPPLRDNEPKVDDKDAPYRELLNQIKGE